MTGSKKAAWSFIAGEKRHNRVRVYEDVSRKTIFAEFYEPGDRANEGRRRRVSLGHADHTRAKADAERLATKFRAGEPATSGIRSLQELFDLYLAEVTPQKSATTRKHDVRAAALFIVCFGASAKPHALDRRDWDRFIKERRSGKLSPPGGYKHGPVRNRVIEYDLKFLLAVLNWASQSRGEDGRFLLERNPLRGLPVPRELSPVRPALSQANYEALTSVANAVDARFALALMLAHETGHRINAIRLLQWRDIDLERLVITWRADHDKGGYEHETPLTSHAVTGLRQVLLARQDEKSPWVFPAPKDSTQPCSRHLLRDWWQRAAKLAKVPASVRLGYHSLRRKFATDLRDLPLKDQCLMGGWKDPQTILKCYQQPDPEELRQALEKRSLSVASGSKG